MVQNDREVRIHSIRKIKQKKFMYFLSIYRSEMMLEMLRVLEDVYENELGGERICQHYEALQEGFRPRKYQPLMSRTKCSKFSLSHIHGLNGKIKILSISF